MIRVKFTDHRDNIELLNAFRDINNPKDQYSYIAYCNAIFKIEL
mgnify:CR=1 FL=1